jgi:hypothetical protein
VAQYLARIESPWTAERTFAFMADMRQFAHWDPNIKSVTQVRREGAGEGSAWDVTVRGLMGDITLRYETVAYAPPRRVVLRAATRRMESLDEVRIETDGRQVVIVYDAQLWLRGPLAVLNPLLGLVLRRIGNRAAAGLRELLADQAPGGEG